MKSALFVLIILCSCQLTFSQGITDWDNQFFISNKVAMNRSDWRYSGELQVRLKDDAKSLDVWYFEFVATYMVNKNWEIVPDLRFSIKPTKNEWRPGIGVIYKHYPKEKIQFVHQVKYQADFEPGETKHGLRYIFFFNYLIHEKFLPNAAAGVFYRWQNDFTGLQFIRVGVGLAYIINVQHSLNFSYFVGFTDTGETWVSQGIPLIQLIININKDYKYVPAKYISF